MDYCSSCSRHLNGALVCPGCGAYAPDIAPLFVDGTTASAPAAPRAGSSMASPETAAATQDVPPVEQVQPAQQGRAARRRQLARWKKNKRRAAVASAVALVGGGLTLASMERQTVDRAQAATAPKVPDTGDGEKQEQKPEETTPSASASATAQQPREKAKDDSASQSPTTDAPRQQQPLQAAPRTTSPSAEPEAAAPARPAATATPQPRNTAPAAGDTSTDRSGTAGQQQPPRSSDDSTSTKPGDTSQNTNPSLISTSPEDICLLGLCVG